MLSSLLSSLGWLLVLGVGFSALAHVRPAAPGQPLRRAGLGADLVYWFAGPIVYGGISLMLIAGIGETLFAGDVAAFERHMAIGLAGLRGLPLWAQVAIALVLTDFLQYWTHRLFHRAALWRFHAVHHGPEEVDWLTCVRFHPVNLIVHSTLVSVIVMCLGFDPLVFAILAPFNIIYSGLVHANLDWDFGPLRYVLASPVFHRWHHASDSEARDRNFAATFPVFDLMFGTFHMPKGRLPEGYGVPEDPVPETLLGQLAYPFRAAPAGQESCA